jgi:hypothetical protein
LKLLKTHLLRLTGNRLKGSAAKHLDYASRLAGVNYFFRRWRQLFLPVLSLHH